MPYIRGCGKFWQARREGRILGNIEPLTQRHITDDLQSQLGNKRFGLPRYENIEGKDTRDFSLFCLTELEKIQPDNINDQTSRCRQVHNAHSLPSFMRRSTTEELPGIYDNNNIQHDDWQDVREGRVGENDWCKGYQNHHSEQSGGDSQSCLSSVSDRE